MSFEAGNTHALVRRAAGEDKKLWLLLSDSSRRFGAEPVWRDARNEDGLALDLRRIVLRDLVRSRVETELCGNRHVSRVLGVGVALTGACGEESSRKQDPQAGGTLEQSAERPPIRQRSAALLHSKLHLAPPRAKAKSGGLMAHSSSSSLVTPAVERAAYGNLASCIVESVAA